MLLDKFLDYIKVEKRYSINTIQAYDRDLKELVEFLEVKEIESFQEVELNDLRSFVSTLNDKGLKAVTVNRKISVLKKFFNFLYDIKELNSNPAKDIRFLKPLKNIEPPLSKIEVDELLNIDFDLNNTNEFRDFLIIRLLLFTGIRRAELINLTLASINVNHHIIKVKGKGNKIRQVPISPEFSKAFKNYFLKVENEEKYDLNQCLFYTNKGKVIYPKFVHNMLNSYLSMITNKKKKSPHVMRHTFATQLMQNGADINSIKELMGHSAISSTERYTHYNIEELKEVFNHSHPREKNK